MCRLSVKRLIVGPVATLWFGSPAILRPVAWPASLPPSGEVLSLDILVVVERFDCCGPLYQAENLLSALNPSWAQEPGLFRPFYQ